MPSQPCRYAVTLTTKQVGHLELEADNASVQDGALLLWRRGRVIWAMRAGGWTCCNAKEYEEVEEAKENPT